MNRLDYEKPKMKKVELRNQTAIAANCWSQEANGTNNWWYYDYNEGELGYLQFKLDDSCSGNGVIMDVQYMPEEIGKTDDAVEAEKYLNSGLKTWIKQEFTNMGITDDPGQVS